MQLVAEDDTESTMMRVVVPAVPAAAESILHLLVLEAEGMPAQRIPLGEAPIRIGRVPGNDLVLPAAEVSRNHADIRIVAGEAVVTDLGSTNGCYIDGRRIAGPTTLPPGGHLGVGPFMLHYLRGAKRELERATEMEKELERASRYVLALLPPPLPEGRVRTDWRFIPSARVGGDAFGYRWIDEDRFAVYVMDVAGHGAGSSMLAASVMNLLRDRGAGPDPAAVLTALNASFQMEQQGGLFFTLWYGVADITARRIRYAAAGHHPGYLAVPGARGPQALGVRNPPIGMMPAPRFKSEEAELPPGSRLTLLSDGVFETERADGTTRGLQEFIPVLGPAHFPLEGETERLLTVARAAAHRGFADDVSILLLDFP